MRSRPRAPPSAACSTCLFLADGNAVRQMDKPALFAANSPSDRPAVFEPVTLMTAVAQYTKLYRPAVDRDDDLRRALLARAPLRLARPSQQGPRLLEHRHDVVSRRFAELQPHRACRQGRALRARQRVRRDLQGPVGQLGGRRLHPEQRNRPVPRSCARAHAEPHGQALPGEGSAQRRPHAAGLSGDVHGRPVRGRPRARRQACRLPVRRAPTRSRSARSSMPT